MLSIFANKFYIIAAMRFLDRRIHRESRSIRTAVICCAICTVLFTSSQAGGTPRPDQPEIMAEKLYRAGLVLVEKTNYLEALDLLEEAKAFLESAGKTETHSYADILTTIAQTKIKGRLHQKFTAYYIKSALKEIQAANRLREGLAGVPPQKLAEGYYLEGVVHKRFFMRKAEARQCFEKAVKAYPGFAAAKRELSELMTGGQGR
ncbi:hypothetical protein ACFL2Q_09520 [Thermodesulfobacteriota bacterium]